MEIALGISRAMPRDSTDSSNDISSRVAFGLMLIVLLGVVLLRIRLLALPLERDEGEYAYIGWLMLQGVPPYTEAYTMKLPGIHAAYAGLLAVFGHSVEAIRGGLILVNLASVILIYRLCRQWSSRVGAVAAAALFAVVSLGHTVHGIIANAEHFVLLPVLAGIWLLQRSQACHRLLTVCGAGLCFGMAILVKQTAVVFLVFALTWMAWNWRMSGFAAPRKFATRVMGLLAGPLVLYGMLCAWMAAAGTFDNFWRWTVEYPREYVSQVSWSSGIDLFLLTAVPIAMFAWPAILLAAVGIYASLRSAGRATQGVFLVLFTVFSFLAVCPGLYFREHYFLFLIPSVAMAGGVAVDLLSQTLRLRGRFVMLVMLVIASASWSLYADSDVLFRLPPEKVSRLMYGENPFPESSAIAEYIENSTPPSARVAMLGSEPQILFLARRRSATGFLYMYPMTEQHEYAESMQRQIINEIEAVEPELLAVVTVPSSWLYRPTAPRVLFDWMNNKIPRRYALEALVPVGEDGATEILEGELAKSVAPQIPVAVKLLRMRM